MASRGSVTHPARYAALDLEFTGLDPARDRICEVAVVVVADGAVVDEFSSLVRPECPMSPSAVSVTGLTDALLAGAPPFASVADALCDRLEGAVVVSHNIPTDLGFLQRELTRIGRPLPPLTPTLDTLLLARRLFHFPRNNLAAVCVHLGLEPPAHRALADARATAAVVAKALEILDPTGALGVADLVQLIDDLAPESALRLQQRATLADAHRDRKTIFVDYLSTTDPVAGAVRREVEVWAIRHPRFQGFCRLRGGERIFRLDRVTSLRPGEAPFDIPPGFRPRW